MYGMEKFNVVNSTPPVTTTTGILPSTPRDAHCTPQTDCANDPDTEVIAAASAASVQKPSTRGAPASKRSKSKAKRKRISDASSRSSSASPVERSRKTNNKKYATDGKKAIKSSSGLLTVPNAETLSNVIYNKLMHEKQLQVGHESEHASETSVTYVESKRSQRRAVVQCQSFNLKTLEKHLPDELYGTELSKRTVKVLYDQYKNHLIKSVCSITHVPIESNDSHDRMQINGKNYLFCALNKEFGHDYVSIEQNPELVAQSLLMALRPKCNNKKNSLDLVFRQALKELCEEILGFDEDDEVSLENPVLVSGCYLELRVLEKMRSAYSKHIGEDIIKYLTDSCPNQKSPLKSLVEESTCKMYIQKLLDQYDLRPANFKKTITEVQMTPQNMRVWTDIESQRGMNVEIVNHINAVYVDLRSEWSSLSEEERKTRSMSMEFAVEYARRMQSFMKTRDRLLAEMLKASELMAWMCLGVTTNSAPLGTASFAASYLMANTEYVKDRTNPVVCWNYPLATLYRRVTRQPVISLEKYLNE